MTAAGVETVIHSFGETTTDAKGPEGGLTSYHGQLFGTTTNGGENTGSTNGAGTLYSIHPDGTNFAILYSFGSSTTDATSPAYSLLAHAGALYGTASGGANGSGAVFAYSPKLGAESIVYSFPGAPGGATPDSGLVGSNGLLYGITLFGGTQCRPKGYGTIFEVKP